ncbi:MAG: sulfatase-like hydrolase/transferase [Thalassotalea sp.]
MKLTQLFKLLPVVSLLACGFSQANEPTARPNIVFILADDLGYGDVGFNGAKDIVTPALDALAAQGTVFTSAYAAHPFCGPSRAGLLTGRYPHNIGSQFNLPTSDRSGGLGITTDEQFISKTLKNSGYFTGAIGKWHLGEDAQYHPNQRGFDEFYGFLNGGHNYFPEQFEPEYKAQRAKGLNHAIFHYLRPLEHNGQEVRETEYITDGLTREAASFIEKAAQNKQQPFFLYLAYNAPHSPMQAKEADMAMFPNIKDKKRKIYAGMVYALDRGVKRVVETLKATGQYENTLIVFMSDNGGKPKMGASNAPLQGQKGDVFEGGSRSPMFMHWPSKIPAGKTFKYPVSSLDLYPTFVSLAGAELPKGKLLDGKNIWSNMMTGKDSRQNEMLYFMRHRKGFSDSSARKDNWKIVKTGQNNWKLFDIEKDIGETNDLSAKHPNVVREMVADMEIWSWGHQPPLWFHISEEGFQWRKFFMPRFHETFSLK